MAENPFTGIPARAQGVAIPNVVFSDVLPALADDPAAVAVALYGLQALMGTRGFPRYLTAGQLAGDMRLARYLERVGIATDDLYAIIEQGLGRCVEAGLFLRLDRPDGAALYVLNAPSDRRGVAVLREQGARPAPVVPFPRGTTRSPVFALYEQEIGALTPRIIDELTEAERLYPAAWFERAFREAAAQNARSWRYVQRILERWGAEGLDGATDRRGDSDARYFGGKYGRLLKQRDEAQGT